MLEFSEPPLHYQLHGSGAALEVVQFMCRILH